MMHIKNFINKMSVVEARMNKDVVIPIVDARGLRDDITKLLLELHELTNSNNKDDIIEIEIKGGSFK
jgi:DNA polymerase II small subunit/DNA polymerase delta subunit B